MATHEAKNSHLLGKNYEKVEFVWERQKTEGKVSKISLPRSAFDAFLSQKTAADLDSARKLKKNNQVLHFRPFLLKLYCSKLLHIFSI
jgi:hypothetical protein